MPDPATVTVGIPTFNRPELLERALTCLARQDYPHIHVIVADNGTPGDAVERLVQRFKDRFAALRFHRHPSNIGALGNLLWLLSEAQTKYFMWLADDDEISDSYVGPLVDVLEQNADSVTAIGHWRLMTSPTEWVDLPNSSFPQTSLLARAARFVWRSDDSFFYGVHRSRALQHATYSPFWWPNRALLRNWAYPYLLDMVIEGRILLTPDPSVRFINHDYTNKAYATTQGLLAELVRTIVRRINVHSLYFTKLRRRGGIMVALSILPISLAALGREALAGSGRIAAGVVRRLKRIVVGG